MSSLREAQIELLEAIEFGLTGPVISLIGSLFEIRKELKANLSTILYILSPELIEKALKELRIARENPEIPNWSSEYAETFFDNADLIEGALRRLKIAQEEFQSGPSEDEDVPPPPPPADPYMNISEGLARTLMFIEGLMKSLLNGKVIDGYLYQLYEQLKEQVLSMQPLQMGLYKDIMVELQRSMERVLFGSSTNAQSQIDLLTVWTQLLYLYNQMAVINKITQEGASLPPPRPSEDEPLSPAPQAPPPAPLSPSPSSPPSSPPQVRPVSPAGGGRPFSSTDLAAQGTRLRKTEVAPRKEAVTETPKSQIDEDQLRAAILGRRGAIAKEEEEEGNDEEWTEAQITFMATQISARMKAAVRPHMDVHLIGHPLFQSE